MTSGDRKPEIYGLVLAGGKSVRMGRDKGLSQWYGKPHRYYLAELLAAFCTKVYISCREEQLSEIDSIYNPLVDAVPGMGPMGGLLTAFGKHPGSAWLVTACDLPLLDAATLAFLVENRNLQSMATTFESPHDGLPEPLITIWEPSSHPILQQKANEGFSCPRRVLINNNITILQPPVPNALLNANTPEDAALINKLLKSEPGS